MRHRDWAIVCVLVVAIAFVAMCVRAVRRDASSSKMEFRPIGRRSRSAE